MTFVIGAPCVDVMDRSCLQECPVDCIYEGERKLYINPAECIDCGACEPACPVEAIASDRDDDEDFEPFVADAIEFFQTVLPGRDEPIGSPGGARSLGPVAADSSYVRAMPRAGSDH
ncbi:MULTISPECIES: ferredoxin [Rhodococcus]|uniref:Ferredoxin n=1 Tax=Rhodococcus tibetensis TaxID=2965064 RepID=A0ABT1QF35_9NOCA|nr:MULTISPECIES: ferredoxin [unclassified Rhodococcus (in: high G+C Gram-positive bacteria)]MCQ4120866.1 ferredoxin family protein [Rhodococcus sp. FXJ9.536]